MTTLQYYLSNILPLVFGIAAISFLLGLGLGWLAWASYRNDATHWEDECARLKREHDRLTSVG